MTSNLGIQDADRLYREHVEPLEQEHRGKYVGVTLDGKTVVKPTLIDAVTESARLFGKGASVVFRVGDKVVGRVR